MKQLFLHWYFILFLYFYNERSSQCGCTSWHLFFSDLPVCCFPELFWESHFPKPRPGSSSVAATTNSALKFSVWKTEVSFRSQPEYQRQDSVKAQVRHSDSWYQLARADKHISIIKFQSHSKKLNFPRNTFNPKQGFKLKLTVTQLAVNSSNYRSQSSFFKFQIQVLSHFCRKL